MTITALHANVQRSRFAHHTIAALASLLRAALLLPLRALRPARALTAAESAAVEAQRVRSLAHSYSETDPGFAADLYAGAERHETLHAD